MKKLIATIAISAFAFIGTAVESDARPHRGGYGHHDQSSQIYVSGYRHGRPVYTQKIFVGYDCYNRPVYRYRTVAAPRRHYDNHSSHCDTGYGRGGYNRGGYSNYDNHRSSGARVSFSFGR